MTNTMRLRLLRIVMLIALAFVATSGAAVGLGPLRLQSALGQPLRASLQLLGDDTRGLPESCIRSRLTSPDGTEILRPEIELRRQKNGSNEIFLSSRTTVDEPAVTLLVELICNPTMHRNYDLLLDMRDGLPHVLSSQDGGSKESLQSATASAPKVPGASRADSSGKRKSRDATAADTEMPPMAGRPKPIRSRARGLPGARNVLKLSQDDINFQIKPGAGGLKLSDTLSVQDGRAATVNADDVKAAKARFLAMLKNEDPLMLAQKQISTLQTQLQQAGVSPSSPSSTVKNTTAAPAPAAVVVPTPTSSIAVAGSTSQSVPGFNKWLLLLAVLLIGSIGIAALLNRSTKHAGRKRSGPWWLAADDAESREAALLDSVRRSMESKKTSLFQYAPEFDDVEAREDKVLHQYVAQFVDVPREDAAGGDAGRDQSAVADKADMLAIHSIADSGNSVANGVSSRPHRSPKELSTFEPISDVMQEAEFWKMLNETSRAIDILEHYCDDETSSSPAPWLYLADLYGAAGETERYAQLRERFRQRFNSRISDEDEADEGSRHSLEQYPLLMQQISDLWGGKDILPFLQGLLINNRDDPRQGFDLLVYREILLLIDIARERDWVEP